MPSKEYWWWGIGIDPFTGKRGLIGGFRTDDELVEYCREKSINLIDRALLDTRNKDSAKAKMRGRMPGIDGFMDLGSIGSL